MFVGIGITKFRPELFMKSRQVSHETILLIFLLVGNFAIRINYNISFDATMQRISQLPDNHK